MSVLNIVNTNIINSYTDPVVDIGLIDSEFMLQQRGPQLRKSTYATEDSTMSSLILMKGDATLPWLI